MLLSSDFIKGEYTSTLNRSTGIAIAQVSDQIRLIRKVWRCQRNNKTKKDRYHNGQKKKKKKSTKHYTEN
jgi:hypothetical protein